MARGRIFDGQPFTVEVRDLAACWGGYSDGCLFRCRLCGHRFQLGDRGRWVYDNDASQLSTNYGNYFVCEVCDGPDVRQRAVAQAQEARTRFWWLTAGELTEG